MTDEEIDRYVENYNTWQRLFALIMCVFMYVLPERFMLWLTRFALGEPFKQYEQAIRTQESFEEHSL